MYRVRVIERVRERRDKKQKDSPRFGGARIGLHLLDTPAHLAAVI